MRRLRWVWIIVGVIGVVILVGLLWMQSQIRGGWPRTDGVASAPALDAPVEIIRDKMGVPHIYAENRCALFFAQGYVHAQDRFWQMEFWRRIGSGRLAEVLGESALPTDRFVRTLGWRQVAEIEAAMLDGEERDMLEAYADGVNAYLDSHRHHGAEFSVLRLNGIRFEPDPWTPADTLTWGKVMAWDLGGNMDEELGRARLTAVVGTEKMDDLLPRYPEDRPVIVPGENVSSLTSISSYGGGSVPGWPTIFGQGNGLGSNNWVVSGDLSETGMPILSNDPHLGIQMPSIWYEVGLHCTNCPFEVVGFSFAGMPGVIIGHNAHIAWGVTNVGPDVQDLYVERLNPDNPDQYEFQGGWEDMSIRHEEILVAGWEEPVTLNVRSTRHGPIINDVIHGTNDEWSFGWQPLALKWTALEPGTLASSVLAINRAENWEMFQSALALWDAPSQNFVYADVEGNIGYQMPGNVPIRAKGDGNAPVPGWTGKYEWIGTIPFDELPSQFNPPEQFIVTANNAVVNEDYAYHISSSWSVGYRAQRIKDLLLADGEFSIEDMGRIQLDSHNYSASEVLPYLLALDPQTPEQAQALEYLAEWDYQMVRESRSAAIYAGFWAFLMEELFADELGERPEGGGRDQLAVRYLLEEPNNVWWDDQTTRGQVETRDVILERALEEGLLWLQDELGRKMEDWQYGQIHTATFRNQSIGECGIGLIEGIFNRGPFEVDGGAAIINATSWNANEPAVVDWLPSMRQIIDVGNWENSRAIHTTGQSGHPYSPHYIDMVSMWQEGEFHIMHWERSAVEADAEGTLRLEP